MVLKALHAAARKVGDLSLLATHLHAPSHKLQRWMSGAEPTPRVYFLRSVDIIAGDSEAMQPRASRLVIDSDARRAYLQGRLIPLPLTEWAVLESLAARLGRVVPSEQIRRELSLWTGKGLGGALQMYVFRLRLKLEPAGLIIRTFHGAGYMLEDTAPAA